jgi:hypothetical protein
MHPGNIFVATDPDGPLHRARLRHRRHADRYDKNYLAQNFLAFFQRDYKRVATAHIEAGWAPADTRVDEFEAAIRAVCEPIFDRPLHEISFGRVLLRLFQTSRRFNVEIQPQLVMLQKTLLNIEGLGRQLDPNLDLWKTAKPFLERWMSEQVGRAPSSAAFKQEAPTGRAPCRSCRAWCIRRWRDELLRAVEERATPDRVSPGVLSWVEDLRRASIAVAKKKARPAGARQQLFYMLKWTPDQRHFGIEIAKGKFPDSAEEWWNIERALVSPPQFVTEEDLGILRPLWADRLHETGLRAFGLGPKHGAEVLERLVASGRFYPDSGDGLPLGEGEPRPAEVGWRVDVRGCSGHCWPRDRLLR